MKNAYAARRLSARFEGANANHLKNDAAGPRGAVGECWGAPAGFTIRAGRTEGPRDLDARNNVSCSESVILLQLGSTTAVIGYLEIDH